MHMGGSTCTPAAQCTKCEVSAPRVASARAQVFMDLWGTERLVTKRGPRVLSFLPAHFVPEPVNMADHSLESVGQLLKFPCADFQLIYVMHLQDAKFEPKNGTNAAAWVARKKIVLPCGRVVRMK